MARGARVGGQGGPPHPEEAITSDQPANAIVVRSAVPPLAKHGDARPYPRYDFLYSCAYCTMAECEAQSFAFHVDHYYPVRTHPHLEREYENLMYSCDLCNYRKGGFSPDSIQEALGQYILRPDRDDPRRHFVYLAPERELKPTTAVGSFTNEMLDLNRDVLKRLRDIRERAGAAQEFIANGVHAILATGLDLIPPGYRHRVSTLRGSVTSVHAEVRAYVEKDIREALRSPLLPDDTPGLVTPTARQAYLEEVGAMLPGLRRRVGAPATKVRRRRRRGRR